MKLYDKKLEGLRGLCALVVAISHIFGFTLFGTKGSPVFILLLHLQFAHMAVLIFFILSGYVMGISHLGTDFNAASVGLYLKKRLVRLYPIYLTAIGLCVLLGYRLLSWPQVAGHIFFLQEFLVKTFPTNTPLWSLSFEFAYYLLFMLLWAFQRRSKYLYVGISLVIFILSLTGDHNNCIRSLFLGWIFWMAGLYTSRLFFHADPSAQEKRPFISYLFILLSVCDLQSGGFLMRLLHISFTGFTQIRLNDLVYLPVCMVIMLAVSGRRFRFFSWLVILAYTIPALNILALLYFRHNIRADINWMYGIAFFILAILSSGIKIRHQFFAKLEGAGKISFAIYLFHFPISFFLDLYLGKVLSGVSFMLTGILLTFFLTWGVAYLMERIVQPRLRNLFLRPSPIVKK
jgi:peptidoglycan/LPS O-acetylase OafA/YrhL